MAYKAEFRQEITAKDGTKQVLTNLQNNIKRTGKAGATAGATASSGFKSMLGPLVAVAASVMALKKVLDLAKEGAQANAVEAAFERLNAGGVKLLATMRQKSGGILDDTTLQMISNKLSSVTKDTETMGRVAEAGLKIAAATGKDYKTTLEGLTQAIVTGRSASLASLGIVVDAKKVQAEYAATLGKTASQLTQAEKKTAAMNGALAETERQFGSVDTAPLEDGVTRLQTKFANLRSTIAQTTSSFGSFLMDWAEGIDRIERKQKGKELEGLIDTYSRAQAAHIGAGRELDEIIARANDLAEPYEKVIAYAEKHSGEIKSAAGLMKSVYGSEVGAWRWVSRQTAEWMEVKRALEEAQRLGMSYGATITALASVVTKFRQAQIEALKDYNTGASVATDEIGEQVKLEQKRLANLSKYWKLQDDILKLSIRGYASLNAEDRARLDLLALQATHMVELGTASEETFLSWENARAQDALGKIAEKARGLLDTVKKLSTLTASDALKGMLGIGGKKSDTKDKTPGTGPSRAELAEQAREELGARIDAANAEYSAREEKQNQAAANDTERVKRVAMEAQAIQAQIYDFEQALAGKRSSEEDVLAAERTKRIAALTKEGGLASLDNYEAAKKAIELWYDEETRRIIREREEEDFRRRLDETRRNATEIGAVFQSVASQNLTATSKWNQGIAATGQGIAGIGSALTQTDSATGKLTSATSRYATAGAGALGAASAWIKGERRKAVVLAMMEAAHAVATFETPWVAAAHGVAAGLYGAIAGGAFGGGGRHRAQTVYRAPEKAASSPAGAASAGNTYVFNVRGFINADQKQLAKGMADTLNAGVGLATIDRGLIGAGGQL